MISMYFLHFLNVTELHVGVVTELLENCDGITKLTTKIYLHSWRINIVVVMKKMAAEHKWESSQRQKLTKGKKQKRSDVEIEKDKDLMSKVGKCRQR